MSFASRYRKAASSLSTSQETTFFEKQSRTGCKGGSDDKARRCSGGNVDSSVSGECAGRGTRRIAPAYHGDTIPGEGNRDGLLAGRAARDDATTRAVLGHRI